MIQSAGPPAQVKIFDPAGAGCRPAVLIRQEQARISAFDQSNAGADQERCLPRVEC